MARRPSLIFACAVAALALGGCASSSGTRPGQKTVLMEAGPEDVAPHPEPRRKQPQLISHSDDARTGREEAMKVADAIGVLDDAALQAYVDRIGRRLLKGLSHRAFRYEFYVVDQVEPNAFALPGGYVFISRGLLALANNEDEMANVIGHEITHAAERHAAARQALMEQKGILLILPTQVASLAAYSRDMERSADRGGQILAAAAGYDPQGMATFLASLQAREQLLTGAPRRAGFFDTHPTSSERASLNAIQASELRWERDPSLGDTTASHLHAIAGIDLGPRPSEGVFVGERFLHPDLDFQIRFPEGWRTANERQMVGAQAPRGDAVVMLESEGKERDPKSAAEAFVAENQQRMQVVESKPIKAPDGDGWRLQVEAPQAQGSIVALVTFLPHGRATWRFTGATLSFSQSKYQGLLLATFRSFRSLTPEQRASIRGTRLELVEASAGETIGAICRRTDNVWSPAETSLSNGVMAQHVYRGGELVKVARSYAYTPGSSRP